MNQRKNESKDVNRPNALVVVLGDVGRSPRMANHAFSLSKHHNYNVYIVGYSDTKLHPVLVEDPYINLVSIAAPWDFRQYFSESISLALKLFWSLVMLFWTLLFRVPWRVHLILLQNPPGLPAMFVCRIVSSLKRSRYVIDWHNYTYRMLQHKWNLNINFSKITTHDSDEPKSETVGEGNRRRISRGEREVVARERRKSAKIERKTRKSLRQIFTEQVYRYEGWMGRSSDAALCVSKAMRDDLRDSWGIPSAVFYDRPPEFKFKNVTLEEIHDLFMRLSNDDAFDAFRGERLSGNWNEWSAFTYCTIDGQVMRRTDRPLLLISSTSWTPDEDFGILLDALVKYDRYSVNSSEIIRIVCAVTGRGEQKEEYIERIKRLQLVNVQIVTPWLEAKDYPTLLAAADLGISLHTSTSGLDLPMKVVDMFGARIPVLAKRYLCIGELVVDGQNGHLFENAHELCQLIQGLATGFPNHSKVLEKLKTNILNDPLPSWEETWEAVCATIMKPERDVHLERVLARE